MSNCRLFHNWTPWEQSDKVYRDSGTAMALSYTKERTCLYQFRTCLRCGMMDAQVIMQYGDKS